MKSADASVPEWLTPGKPKGVWRAWMTSRGVATGRPTAVEVLSELALFLGAVSALFVIWMLFWTDVTVQATQERILGSVGWALEPSPDATPVPVSHQPPPDRVETLLQTGATIAVLRVPRFGDDYIQPVSEGIDKAAVLDILGVGHYPGSALPGEMGNFALAGHRTTFGKPFNRIADLQVGDEVIVDTAQARFTYVVTEHLIVTPDRIEVVAPEPGHPGAAPTNRWITMTSCHPMFSAKDRYVVHGVLESWTSKAGAP